MELILIRHGETDWNKDHVFRGKKDMRLNATGILQADAVGDALADRVFEAVYSSPLKRAMVTATRVAKPHEMQVREAPDLSDINFGLWEGLTQTEVQERWPAIYKRWVEGPSWVKFPGGEGVRRAWKRVNSGLREILFLHGTGTIVIVSHRVPIKMMTAYLMGKKRGQIHEVKHDPGAISIFEVDGVKGRPIVLNDRRHLEKLGLPAQDDF